jgi:hypothetical protein
VRPVKRLALAVALALAFVGCGQTDYASKVTTNSAQLNGTITTLTAGVTTTAWFEYWPATNPSNVQQTAPQNVTATGPLSAAVNGLANQTEYRYRLCGTEDDSDVACAQTRRFTTGRTTVQAYGNSVVVGDRAKHLYRLLDFDLVVGSSGVAGPAFVESVFNIPFQQQEVLPIGAHADPDVTCFESDGNSMLIGLHSDSGLQGFVLLRDGGPLGSGQDVIAAAVNGVQGFNQDPSDCTTAGTDTYPLATGEIAISSPPPTLR